MSALQSALQFFGTKAALARAIGVRPMTVQHWFTSDGRKVPLERAVAIEKASGGKITAAELRPDVFGDPSRTPDEAA